MKRMLSILISMLLLLSLLAGCTASGTTTVSSATTAAMTSATPAATTNKADRTTISFIGGYGTDFDLYKDSYVVKTIEDAVDINLKLINVSVWDAEAIALMLASKEYPDCAWYRGQEPFDLYYNQQLTRSIPDKMLAQYAPEYYATITKTYPELAEMYMDKSDKTQRYALTGFDLSAGMHQYYWTSWYRYDWIKKFNLSMPDAIDFAYKNGGSVYATNRGMDIRAFRDYLDKCVNGDPDGNGTKDTYGIVGTDCLITPLMAAFGVYYSWSLKGNVEEDGETEMWYAQDGFKDYLKYMADLYANGLIDKEIFTLDANQAKEKVNSGKVAYMSYPANQTTAALNGTEEFPAGLLAANPEISLLIAASEVGLDGTYGSSGYSDYIAYEHFTVSDQVDDAKLIKVLQFFEYTTSKQGRYTYSYGTEGKTWKYNEQGKPAFVDNVKDILGNDGDTIWKQSGTFRQFICDEFYLEWCNDVQFKTIGKYAIGKDAIWCANMKHTYRSDPYNSTILAELEAKNNPNIEQYVKEYVASVVSGTANIDSTWDQYMTTINGLGYTEIKAALQKCPLTDEIRG